MGHVRLDGKAVVITGSGRGIGAACAAHAAALGALVVVNDLAGSGAEDVAAGIRATGGVAVAHPADVSVRAEAAGLIARCLDEFDRIDGLVNNAALMSLSLLEDHDEEHLRRLLDVNVVGGFHCAAEAIGPMYAQGSGSIVNVTSGAHTGMAEMGAYAATKGAVASMTYAWAVDATGRGVRVNALSPLAAGAMVAQSAAHFGHPLAAPEPARNAPAVSYLLADDSAHVTGQIVRVDGSHLSLMAHPAIVELVLYRECWTSDDVARAFADVLDARRSPAGLGWAAQPPSAVDPLPREFR